MPTTKKKDFQNFSIQNFPVVLAKKIRVKSILEDRTIGEIVIAAIEQYVAPQPLKKSR
jgi:hypothetical protein